MPSPLNLVDFVRFIAPPPKTLLFVMASVVSVAALAVLYKRYSGRGNRQAQQLRTQNADLYLSIALVVATSVVMLSQTPTRFQHYQYFLGALIALGTILAVSTWSGLRVRDTIQRVAVIAASVGPIFLGSAMLLGAERLTWLLDSPNRWMSLDRSGYVVSDLEGVASGSQVVFLNVGGGLLNPQGLPNDVELSCRFFYHFPHLIPRYGDQMRDCLSPTVDLVLRRTDGFVDPSFDVELKEILQSGFVLCQRPNGSFELWSRTIQGCPKTHSS